MFTTNVDTSGLNEALNLFAKEARKGMNDVLPKEVGIMVGHMIALTPPAAGRGQAMSDSGGITTEAKKRGEASVKADIATLFPTTRLKPERVYGMIENGFEWGTGRGKKIIRDYAESISDLERIHNFARSPKTGRVRTGQTGANMALVKSTLRTRYMKQKAKNVGRLNAGWLKAANKLKTSKRATPAWIRRHGEQAGGVQFRTSKSGLTITVSNRMRYMPRDMEKRTARAINRRIYGLTKALEAMVARKAKMAERRQNRR